MPFDAFISYSHAADDALAPSVQRGLQTLARPWNRRRALEVFRDQTGLAVSPGLWSSIRAGLDESEHFVLLASPEAAASTWVNQEIEHWSASHPIDRLLPVVTAGEWIWNSDRGDFDWDLSTAVPPALRDKFREEPRHLDLRWARTETDLDLRNSRFREAIAQLAAPMHHMSPQDLESSDVARFRHLVRLRRAVVAVLAALLVLVSVAGVLAVQNAREARQQQELAEQQARRALSLQLLAQASVLSDSQKTLSLLLAAEATRLAPAEAWDSLVTGLQDTTGLDRIFDIPGGADADTAVSALDVAANTYVSVTQQEDVQLWDLDSGKRRGQALLTREDLYQLSPTELVLSDDLALAVMYRCSSNLCNNSTPGIQLWDIETRERRLLPHSANASSLVFSNSGDLLAAASSDGFVHIWNTATRKLQAKIPVPFPGEPTGLAFSPDDKALALAQKDDGRILVWDVDRPRPSSLTHIPFPAKQYPDDIAFGPGDVVASRDGDGRVRLWDAGNGQPRWTLKSGSVPIVSLAVGPDGTLATASGNGNLSLWDVERRRQEGSATSSGSRGRPQLMFDPKGALVSIGSDIRSWDVSRWGQIGEELYHHQAAVTALSVSSDGMLASGDERGVIRLWDIASGQPSGPPLLVGRSGITALAFSSEGVLGSGDEGGTIRLWDSATGGETRRPLEGHDGAVASLAFSSDGTSLAAGYRMGPHGPVWQRGLPIHVWDVATGSVAERLNIGFEGGVASVAFSPLGKFASAGADFLASWDVGTWEYQRLVEDSSAGPYTAVAFSPDGRTLASSAVRFARDDNRTVILWTMPTGTGRAEQLGEPLDAGRTRADARSFGAMAFSPDGELLAGAGDGGVQLWDVPTQEPIGERLGSFPASSIAVSPDGSQVIVGDSAGVVQAYPATVDGWLSSACALVSRNLSQRERELYLGSEAPDQIACPEYG